MKFKTISTVTIFLLIMSLTACGGGGGGGEVVNNDTSLLDGYFLDNVVDDQLKQVLENWGGFITPPPSYSLSDCRLRARCHRSD